MEKKAELYRGKAKSVYTTDDPSRLVLLFRNDTSAFDGQRIEQLDRKGMVNNKFNHFIMTKLEEAGIPTQMDRLLSDNEVLVKKLDMVPIECVVRNVAAGSICRRLGVEEGLELNPPTFEFFLKNDPLHDPMVNEYHIRSFGWATDEQVARMKELTFKVNDVLKKMFDDAGLILVDYKLEFGVFEGQVVLGDEIVQRGRQATFLDLEHVVGVRHLAHRLHRCRSTAVVGRFLEARAEEQGAGQSQADEHDGLDLAGHLRLTSGGFHGLAEEDAQTNARAKSTDTVTDDGQVAGDLCEGDDIHCVSFLTYLATL